MAIEEGHTYFNIHTVMFPMGEIAGQILVAGAVGGPRVGAVHSGVFSPVVPVGGAPVFTTDSTQLKGTRTATAKKAV